MLQFLKIRDLALLERTEIEFDEGFLAVTGETGAGKSVLLGALSLLSGSRGDKGLIRQGADSCEVEAGLYFEDSSEIDGLLKSLELPRCEEGALILRRTLSRQRMPRIEINGRSATVSKLQELGESWIDFHGPGEPQKLFHEKWQRALLDLYARNDDLQEQYSTAYHQWCAILRQIDQLRNSERLGDDEADFLRGQVAKIDRAEISTEAIEELEQSYTRVQRGEELIQLANRLADGLGGEEGVGEQLGDLLTTARELASIDGSVDNLRERIESLVIEAHDLGAEFGNLAADMEVDEEAASATRERMELWLDLRRQYGPTAEEVLERRQRMADRLDNQGNLEARIAELEKEAAQARKSVARTGKALRQSRETAAQAFSTEAADLMKRLGFKRADFRIEVFPEEEPAPHGDSSCRYLFAPNAGQDLLALNKIASSGELARVMLALKAVLARVDETPVLVFDEVDSNIGGETASVVGRELADLGKRHQVLCVTHIPQVAASARNHLVVEKDQNEKSTHVIIRAITRNRESRVAELARMLGDRESASGQAHAERLLGE